MWFWQFEVILDNWFDMRKMSSSAQVCNKFTHPENATPYLKSDWMDLTDSNNQKHKNKKRKYTFPSYITCNF